ncbi:MAG: hypothetical protein HYS18_13925 [Burkholderiales bacterium]|nr:hypothetical protein [Burkholderiales bacterium]
MLKEIRAVRQIKGEPQRRWFTSNSMDLVVWCGDNGGPTGFQLCYDKGKFERALSWSQSGGYSHMAVDDGESGAALRYKSSPILIADGELNKMRLIRLFVANSAHLPQEIAAFVCEKLESF